MKMHTPPQGSFKGLAIGKPFVQTRTELMPTGDKLIQGVQTALWDAWQIGLQKGGGTVYPRLPLLDKEPFEPEV